MTCKYNFSAGPALLPKAVLEKANSEFMNWQNTGMSVMEMSHRGKEFMSIFRNVESSFRDVFSVPDNYKVLFLQGGAITQNFMVPMNLKKNNQASYVVSGYWSKRSFNDAQCFSGINLAASSESKDFVEAPKYSDWHYDQNDAYIHFCVNETIHGVEYFSDPEKINIPIIADMSSTILSRKIDVSKYGVIYAGAQKNIGPSGLTLLIVRDDLIGHAALTTPTTFNWQIQAENDSMINTPTTYSIYIAGLVFDWLQEQGGLEAMEQINIEKSELLYSYIDDSDFYYNDINKVNRSRMNIPFRILNDELTMKFVAEAEAAGLYQVKGHRLVGGLRASLYNAMPIEGVEALLNFMEDFAKKNK
ncbi:MAG: 3-phosphoserine/phosphohydroxythreonine transaminase [Nitrosomonadales bacterium]